MRNRPTPASHSAGGSAMPSTTNLSRLVRLVASIAVLVLVGGAAIERSRTVDTPTADHVYANDNLNGANGSPSASPSASQSAKAKAAAKAKGKSTAPGFTGSSAYIPGSGQTYLGAAGDSQALSRATGIPLSDHAYAFFSGKVPVGRMITVKDTGSWASVAAAAPGSTIYNNIVRWAQTIKARGGVIMFAYHHEPEGSNSAHYGTAAQYIAAYRHVVTIFRAQGVRNVNYTWQMTAYAFRASSSDSRYASRWYPGDAYVDSVGADAYNWSSCGQGNGKWQELKDLGDPVLAFARAHGKRAAFPEFASDADSRRAQWTYNALAYIAANRSMFTGAFYFYRPPTVAANSDCKWPLSTSAEYLAYASLGRNRAYFTP
ncbi:MAG: glycosyl hydrolase [Mycobacteriales bacterium]